MRYRIMLAAAFLFALALADANPLVISEVRAVQGSSIIVSPFQFNDNPVSGQLSVENDNVQVVWNYKQTAEGYYNRSGGSIYQLYDKRTDPQKLNNLVAVTNSGGRNTTPNYAGIGGLGATHVWELGRSLSASDVGDFGRLASRDHYIDSGGNAVFQAEFIVSSTLHEYDNTNRPDNYKVNKRWTVYPNGQIRLDITMTFLRSYWAAEPAYDFSFNRHYGWTTASYMNHIWFWWMCGGSGSNAYENTYSKNLTIDNIHTSRDFDYQLNHAQKVTFSGKNNGSSVTISMDNNGRGFEGGGIFHVGQAIWGDTANPTVEFSCYSQRANGNTIRFMSWWGGSPPGWERHKLVPSGLTWSDTIWIEMEPDSVDAGLEITGDVIAEDLQPDGATLGWSTNKASDSTVTFWEQGQPQAAVSSADWTPEHHIILSNLKPLTTYYFEARSKNGTGEAVKQGSFTTSAEQGIFLRTDTLSIEWASFQDYLQRKLTVDFNVRHVGMDDAVSVLVDSIEATSGVTGTTASPDLGAMLSGDTRPLTVKYFVPNGVSQFYTTIRFLVTDELGQEYVVP